MNWGFRLQIRPCAICGSTKIWAANCISTLRYALTLPRFIAYRRKLKIHYEGCLNLR